MGASSTESTEREGFAKVDTRLDEIKGMNMGDMSDDDAEKVLAERKELRAQKEEMMGAAQMEATAENQERSEAEKVAEVVKAEAEANAQAEKVKQIEERKKVDAVQAEALLAEIKGVGIESSRFVSLDDAQDIDGIRIKDFNNPKDGQILDKKSFENQGLIDGTYARNGNNIIFRKGEKLLFMTENSSSSVVKQLEKLGLKKVEGVGVPSLGDPEMYYSGASDSTLKKIQNSFEKYK